MTEIRRYKLDAAFAQLKQFDSTSQDDAFIEVSLWHNGEGFDVRMGGEGQHRFGLTSSDEQQRFSLTWGQFKALKRLVKELDD